MKKRILISALCLFLTSCGGAEATSTLTTEAPVDTKTTETETVTTTEEAKEFHIEDYITAPDVLEDYISWSSFITNTGTIEDFTYTYKENEKTAKVYLPPEYEEGESYDTMYLLHSAGGSETTYIDTINIQALLDYLITKGDIDPVIVVMPTWNVEGKTLTDQEIIDSFPDEVAYIVSETDKAYKTKASREHRICAGYSMGGITTWSLFVHHFDLFETYINMSGYLWEVSKLNDEIFEKKNLALLESVLDAAEDKTFTLYNYVGGEDFVKPYLLPLLEKCGESEYFDFDSNVTIEVMEEAGHNTKYSNTYLADALRTYYKK